MAALTPKQMRFVEAYDGDATAAARAAGYTGNSLSQRGYRLLRDPAVRAAIDARQVQHGPPAVQPPGPESSLEELAVHVGAVREGSVTPIRSSVWPTSRPAEPVVTPTKVANRMARQAFWTSVMEDRLASLSDRLKASELLAKSEADFVARVAHEGMTIEVVNPYARPAPDAVVSETPFVTEAST